MGYSFDQQQTPQNRQPVRIYQLAALGVGMGMLVAAGAASAATQTFDFSFSGTGGQPGTVTGEILGLPLNGTNVAATSVLIDTDNPSVGAPAVQFNVNSFVENLFTISNGTLTAVQFEGQNGFTQLQLNNGGVNELSTYNGSDIRNAGGLSGVTYTNVTQGGPSAPVPEIPIPLMLSIGMLVPLLAQRLRKMV
jgi:hypothetical protein